MSCGIANSSTLRKNEREKTIYHRTVFQQVLLEPTVGRLRRGPIPQHQHTSPHCQFANLLHCYSHLGSGTKWSIFEANQTRFEVSSAPRQHNLGCHCATVSPIYGRNCLFPRRFLLGRYWNHLQGLEEQSRLQRQVHIAASELRTIATWLLTSELQGSLVEFWWKN